MSSQATAELILKSATSVHDNLARTLQEALVNPSHAAIEAIVLHASEIKRKSAQLPTKEGKGR
jgi:hypothetical protein